MVNLYKLHFVQFVVVSHNFLKYRLSYCCFVLVGFLIRGVGGFTLAIVPSVHTYYIVLWYRICIECIHLNF